MDREDRPDGDVGVDVGAAVERIEQEHVIAGRELPGDLDQPLLLLRGHHAKLTVVIHGVEHHVVRVLVQLAHFLAVDVLLSDHPQDVHQSRLADLAMDQLGRQREVVQDIR